MPFNSCAPSTAYRPSSGYADNTAILTDAPRNSKVQAAKVTAYAQWSRLQANVKKCTVSAILHSDAKDRLCKGPTDYEHITSQLMTLTIDGDHIPVIGQTQSYKGVFTPGARRRGDQRGNDSLVQRGSQIVRRVEPYLCVINDLVTRS